MTEPTREDLLETNRRLNRRCQKAESYLAKYRRRVASMRYLLHQRLMTFDQHNRRQFQHNRDLVRIINHQYQCRCWWCKFRRLIRGDA